MACSQKTLELEATALSASQLLERWHQKKILNNFRKLYPLTRFLVGQWHLEWPNSIMCEHYFMQTTDVFLVGFYFVNLDSLHIRAILRLSGG